MIEFYETGLACYRCSASAWEYIDTLYPYKKKPEDVIGCCFCGAQMRVAARPRPRLQPQSPTSGDFRFQYGRFKGLSLAEADAEPNGRRYLEVLRDTNEKLRDRITEYLATVAPSA